MLKSIRKNLSKVTLACLFACGAAGFAAADVPVSPFGADAVPDLYAPNLAGPGGFTTTQGGAPASRLNPAQGGNAQRIVFDAGYLGIAGFGDEKGYGNSIEFGMLFPSKYGAFGGSLHFLNSSFDSFPTGTVFGGNLNAAKEIHPGMSLGAGLNFGIGQGWTLSADLGFRYNMGNLGFLRNFTWGAVLRSLGKSWAPTWFTPIGGVSFDLLRVEGEGGKRDPLVINMAGDLGFPSLVYFPYASMIAKLGLNITIAEIITVSTSWPGASGLNARELAEGAGFPAVPSVGIGVDIILPSGGKRIAGGRLPSDGNLAINTAMKPLYNDIYAMGLGATWSVGVLDKRPPAISIDYPETAFFSPNNDGRTDNLEFPVSITDSRYVESWVMEIKDESGAVARTYRNKELRPETQGVRNLINRIREVKSGVEVPGYFHWDGMLDSGELAPDGRYFFTITAADDNDNTSTSPVYEAVVDNTPPLVSIAALSGADRIFSPDGDGNKDTLVITPEGSEEDKWESGIYDAAGGRVRNFEPAAGSPGALVWDGKDDSGLIVPDGVYSFRISATDKAQNTESASLDNIVVSTIQPSVNLFISDAWFSPNGDGIKDTVMMDISVPVKEGITGWSVNIRNTRGVVLRTISGGNTGGSASVPERLEYEGRNDQGALLSEGVYQAELAVNYRNGYTSTALSPNFNLDVTPPRASVRAGYSAFSPDNDGKQDEMVLNQEGSNELVWSGDIKRAAGAPGERAVRSFRFNGTPPASVSWDGHGDAGTFAADGDYTYELYATDQAGNTGRSNQARFTLSTADTPVMLITDSRAFSPNGDRVKDTISLNPQIQVKDGITGYRIDILDSAKRVVRAFEGRGAPPASISWDGSPAPSAGAAGRSPLPDGAYTAKIELSYVQGNQPSAESLPFILDTQAPRADLSAPYTIFSPNGDGRRDYIPFSLSTDGNDEWEASLANARGQTVKTWSWTGRAPSITWDGTDQAGNSCPDGGYQFTLQSTDEAGNSTRVNIPGINLDARVPRIILTSSSTAIAPKAGETGDLARFNIMLSPQDGIESWSLDLKDDSGTVLRRFGPAPGGPAAAGSAQGGAARVSPPPASVGWNGLAENGALREGRYTPVLTVNYTKGDVAAAQAAPITVDVSGPVLSFSYQPEYFSPDNDGIDDELIMSLGAQDASPLANWSLEIREPQPPYPLFYRTEGRGSPAERVTWDGRSNRGELVQAATDYPVTYRATDVLGNSSVLETKIGVDVLVIRDGDRLRIQVPSIIFRENAADFNTLPTATVDNNLRVLRRVAEILNKFRDYRVQVEGHANPVLRTVAEERNELQPLSESRARAVVNMLVEFGVSRGRLSSVGMGGSRPVVRFEDHDNWWKNRRVEFILIK
ncbi:MAG: OmpA family protein [Treponema sp.]|jgi:outer membrane protein OmpA-like peptidoglycan-associated protein/flagellar hook assembly protein FlgD|nr:OmpA family protein [Treponema sp.]